MKLLLLAGGLADHLGGIGKSVALTGVGSLLVALIVIPLLPESAARILDEVSPTETAADLDDYGPGP